MPPPRLQNQYSAAAFERLVERETDRLELKSGTGGKPLQEAIVAFSNTGGGVILIGVKDDGTVVGRSLDQSTDDQIHRAAAVDAHNVGRYRIHEISVAGRPVVAIEVHEREDGFAQTSDGRILVRRGARNQPLIGDDVWRLASQRTLRRFERSPSGIPRSLVTDDQLRSIADRYGWNLSSEHLDDRLRERGLLVEDELTIAGALVLTDPAKTLGASKFVVEIRWYDDDGPDFRRRMTVDGTLADQIANSARTIMDELGSDMVVTGVLRRDLPRLPPVVVREAIANAVAHRAYDRDRTAIIVEIRPTRVVVMSPGRLPEGVTVETLRQAQASRNPSVIAVLRQFGLTEDAGRGIDVMQDTMRDEMLDPPVFEEVGDFVRVTLPIAGPVTPQERAWLKDLEDRGELEPAERLILVHAARRDPVLHVEPGDDALVALRRQTVPRRLTNADARRITGLDREAARTVLHRLRDKGFLTQHGERGGAYYLLDRDLVRGAAHGMTDEEIEQVVIDAATRASLRNEDVRRLTGLDRVAAGTLLKRLAGRGALERHGERRATEYRLPGD